MKAKTIGTSVALIALIMSAGTVSFAKNHDQGFGTAEFKAGPDTAGKVDDGQSNRGMDGSTTSYGKADASVEAKAGEQDNSEAARDRNSGTHPSN